jgi:uncharacterized protein
MAKPSALLTSKASTFLPMMDLFEQLRSAGMKLTIEQYDLLRQAIESGYGLESWEDLRDVCRVLWVKPLLDETDVVFEQVFEAYRRGYEARFGQWLEQMRERQVPEVKAAAPRVIPPGTLPVLPPRRLVGGAEPEVSSPAKEPTSYGMDAVKHEQRAPVGSDREYLVQVPISQDVVRRTWRSLQRPVPNLGVQELDIAATVERIGREGFFGDVVRRPVVQKKADLLLLVDDDQAMLPFSPVIQPVIQQVENRRITPAQIYRFKRYPTDYFYQWQHPLRGESLGKVLGRLNQLRTIVIIVSDAGAASPLYDAERVLRTGRFLAKLLPCVREVLWLNPLPIERWAGTTAEPIQRALGERMLPLDVGRWRRVMRGQEWQVGVQLWPLMQG